MFPNKQTKPINPLHTMSKNVKNKVATGAQEKTFTVEVTLVKHETIHVETRANTHAEAREKIKSFLETTYDESELEDHEDVKEWDYMKERVVDIQM